MTIYETDYYTWTKEQAELLKLKRFEQVDWSNLIEEIEDLGNNRENAEDKLFRASSRTSP